MENSFYKDEELKILGLKQFGENVLISKKCSIYNAENIILGNNVRIDDFCLLSGKIVIGNYIHIAAYCSFFAGETGIRINDYSGVSARSTIYAQTDDYSGNYLTNPMFPLDFRNIIKGEVILEKHTIVGAASVILPSVKLGEGTAVGAMSLVLHDTEQWSIYFGIPAKKVRDRSKDLLKFEEQLSERVSLK